MIARTGTVSLLILFVLVALASAMPPHPAVVQSVADGTIAEPYFLANRAELMQRGVNAPHEVPRNGELDETIFDSIVLLVDFDDHVSSVEASFFDNLMYGEGTGTVADFYDEASYGDFVLTTQDMPSTIGWLRMPHDYGYYVDGQNGFGDYPNNAQRLVEDAVLAADPFVDFSQYDYDGDDYVDGLFVVHSGTGAELSGDNDDIWSHKWVTNDPVAVDGVFAWVYAMEPEYWYGPGDMTIGVFAHEMGHAVFGLPDLYDYDYDSRGLGDWSLMAGGSWNGNLGDSPAHPDAWSRYQMDFVEPIAVEFDLIDESIPPVENEPVVYRMETPDPSGQQYFLAANRQLVGYDSALPGQGLLIYHVDESVETGNNNQWYPGYEDYGHYLVALEQADGLFELEQNGSADAADPFPGSWAVLDWNAETTPDSRMYDGTDTGVAMHIVDGWQETLTVDLIVGDTQPGPVSITLAPQDAPIVIPAEGGSFFYDALITNTLPAPAAGNVWLEAILPNGNAYHIQTYTVNLQPGTAIDVDGLEQTVPEMAPAGDYEFIANVGYYPSFIVADDSFPFTKDEGFASVGDGEGDWSAHGWRERPDAGRAAGSGELPDRFALGEVYPNPFNERAVVSVALPGPAQLTVDVYNTLGRRVLAVAEGPFRAGTHRFAIDAAELASGVYFLRAEADGRTLARKLALVR
ncbi:MAG: Immune inhibitor A [Calditrichaeota bacterium]|nr:Immune inhibitor A [Calditrichota bacterium]